MPGREPWLWPDFVPLVSPILSSGIPVAQTSRILVELHLIDAEFREAWMPFFSKLRTSCRHGGAVSELR